MGLSHHWHRPTELPAPQFRAAMSDCRKLLHDATEKLAGFDGSGSPIINDDRIVFNGMSPLNCEPLEIAAVEFDRSGRSGFWSFCKTEHLPYDLYVKAALIILHHHLQPAFKVSSDEPIENWSEARDLVRSTFGYGHTFALATE